MEQGDSANALNQQIQRLQKRVSELEQVEAELLRFRLIAEGVQDLISVQDAEGRREYSNPAHAKLFGSREALQGTEPFDRIHPEDRQGIRQLFEDTVRTGIGQEARFRVVAPDHSVRFVQSQGNPIRDATGKVTKVIVVSRDVTELTAALESLTELNQEHEERNSESESLNALADILFQCDGLKDAENWFLKFQPSILPDTSGAVFLFNETNEHYEQVFVWENPMFLEREFKKPDCWAAKLGVVHQVDDPAGGRICGHLSAANSRPYLCTHTTIGREDTRMVFHVQFHSRAAVNNSAEAATRWRKWQSQLAVSICNHLASSVDAQRLRARLEKEATTDQLTGLYNRRFMETELRRELQRHIRNHRVLGIVLGDIDFFKKINDRYGHQSGDQVLREVGGFLQANIRDTDIACRYGGEEFMLIMVDSTREGIRNRVEQLRKGIKTLELTSEGKSLRRITLSLGVAFLPDHGKGVEELERAADVALYRAKEQGRDQVVELGTPEHTVAELSVA